MINKIIAEISGRRRFRRALAQLTPLTEAEAKVILRHCKYDRGVADKIVALPLEPRETFAQRAAHCVHD